MLLLVAFLTVAFQCGAQNSCETLTLGDLFKSLNSIDLNSKNRSLTFKKISNINFSEFQPEGEANLASDFYDVGFDKENTVRKIRHHFKDSLRGYLESVKN